MATSLSGGRSRSTRRLDDMLLFQDVSINDVNEVVKKDGNIFKHTSISVLGENAKKSFCEKKKKAENQFSNLRNISIPIDLQFYVLELLLLT